MIWWSLFKRWCYNLGFKSYLLLICIGVLFLLNVEPFLAHWSMSRIQYKEATEVLLSDMCTNAQTKSRVGAYSIMCAQADAYLSTWPFFRALLQTARDWYICQGEGCSRMFYSLVDNIGKMLILCICIIFACIYFFGIRRGNDYMGRQTLPMYLVQNPPPQGMVHNYPPQRSLEWDTTNDNSDP